MKAIIISAAIMLFAISAQANNFLSNQQQFTSVKPAPVTANFGYFRVHRMANDASLNWAITDPANASYFSIERSYDGSFFEPLAEVNCSGYATHKYRDNTPFPGYIYYRITIHHYDGSTVVSPVEMLRIVKRN